MKSSVALAVILITNSAVARAENAATTFKAAPPRLALNGALPGNAGGDRSEAAARPVATVFTYDVSISDISHIDERKDNKRDKKDKSRSHGFSLSSFFGSRSSIDRVRVGEVVARGIADAVRRGNRFTVREGTVARGWYATALQREGKSAPDTDYMLGGSLEDVCIVVRRQCENDDERWAVEVKGTLQHQAFGRDGELWREAGSSISTSRTFTCAPSNDNLEDMVAAAGAASARRWARMLVFEKRGHILTRSGNRVTIDLGSDDGVGTDTDFVFQRPPENAPGTAAVGDSLAAPAGAPALLTVAARPEPTHPGVFFIVGRPMKVTANSCEVELGYNGSGGLFGPDIKWKKRDTFLATLRDDDIAVLTPRPFTAK